MTKFKLLLSVFFMLCFAVIASAQDAEDEIKTPLKEKLYAGGSFGFSFGTSTNIIISPMIMARLNDRVFAGLGVEYQYAKCKNCHPELTYNQYGGRLFTQYNIVPTLYAHGEMAGYSMERYYPNGNERNFVPFIYVGGGYRKMLTKRSFVTFQVLFDVLQDSKSPYKAWEPIYSVGFGIGI